jgi:hypothetical protein
MNMLFDTPVDLAILRMLAKSGNQWRGVQDLRRAVEWLDDADYVLTAGHMRRLEAMENAGLLEGRRAAGQSAGREWRLAKEARLKRFTGGIDVLRMDQEEALTAGTANPGGTRRVEYKPDTYLLAGSSKAKAERAVRQCPSPWALAERMTKIKWNNPELV